MYYLCMLGTTDVSYICWYILTVNFIVFLLYFENADFFHSFSTLAFYLFITLE